MTLSATEVNQLKHAPAVDGVLPVFHHRWSARAFDNRKISTADLARVFEAARWAPSSSNEQPWRFIVGLKGSDTYSKIFSSLVGFNKAWAGTAAALILGLASAKTASGKPNTYALYDLGAATSNLTLQAAALGILSHQMGGFDHAIARQALEIPEDYTLGAVIALGYQGEPAALENEQLVAREVAPRDRKSLRDFVFSAWGTPADLG
jgi:nitroreductase